jgi:hypothetical protein
MSESFAGSCYCEQVTASSRRTGGSYSSRERRLGLSFGKYALAHHNLAVHYQLRGDDVKQVVAHRLAAVLLWYFERESTMIAERIAGLSQFADIPRLTFAELTELVDKTDGFRLRELLDSREIINFDKTIEEIFRLSRCAADADLPMEEPFRRIDAAARGNSNGE